MKLKVWSTIKIRGTRVPQNAIVPVGRPRPYSIIILNMRFIPKASLRASSQITASSYILERHIWVTIPSNLKALKSWILLCKQTDCITVGISKRFDPTLVQTPSGTQNICMTLYNVGSTSKTLGRRCINVIQCYTMYISPMLVQYWASVADVGLTLKQCWVSVSLE